MSYVFFFETNQYSVKRTFVHIICLVSYFPKELSIKEYTRQYMIFTQSVFSNFMLQCWLNNIRDTRSIFMYINKVSEQRGKKYPIHYYLYINCNS